MYWLDLQGLEFMLSFEHQDLSFLARPGPLLEDVIGALCANSMRRAALRTLLDANTRIECACCRGSRRHNTASRQRGFQCHTPRLPASAADCLQSLPRCGARKLCVGVRVRIVAPPCVATRASGVRAVALSAKPAPVWLDALASDVLCMMPAAVQTLPELRHSTELQLRNHGHGVRTQGK